ncbi:MAG: hypothetical protein R3B67_09295 [Phycisphaerales bacterium]
MLTTRLEGCQVTQGTITEPKFDEHCRRSVHAIRGALLDLYRAVGADPAKPQDVSRRYRLNKNLTWKVARIIGAEDAFEAVRLIPGPGGLDILLEAMSRAGAPQENLGRLREAIDEFDRMIEVHTGDRSQLELVLDSMGAGRPMELSRKLAFRGESGIWGIQAGVRVTAHFLAPNAEQPGVLDLAMLGGLTRVKRLRAVERWPIFQLRNYNDDGSPDERHIRRVAIEPNKQLNPEGEQNPDLSGDPWLMRSFCSGALPDIYPTRRGDVTLYEIGDGPVGLTGEFSCFFGFADPASVSRYRDASNTVGELISSVSVPAEALLFDLFVHESLTEVNEPSLAMIGTLGGSVDTVGTMPLPMPERFKDLGLGAMIDTPLVERYGDAVSAAMAQLGRDASQFRCLRLVIDHPPMSSRVIVRYTLPERP